MYKPKLPKSPEPSSSSSWSRRIRPSRFLINTFCPVPPLWLLPSPSTSSLFALPQLSLVFLSPSDLLGSTLMQENSRSHPFHWVCVLSSSTFLSLLIAISTTIFFSLYTDVVLFFFSFFSKTSASIDPLALVVNKSPAVFIFYHGRSTDFEEKIEGLWTGDYFVCHSLLPSNSKYPSQAPALETI